MARSHQQPDVNSLPRFSSQLISLERYTLSVYGEGEIDLFEKLDIVNIRLLVKAGRQAACPCPCTSAAGPPILYAKSFNLKDLWQ